MSLSCSCDSGDYDMDVGDWYYYPPDKQIPMPERKRRARCCSCKAFIETGEEVGEFTRWQVLDEDSVAGRIDGEDRKIANWYECETCSDLRANLEELGYCWGLGENLHELTAEYAAMAKATREWGKKKSINEVKP